MSFADDEWRDPARDRVVPVRVYRPADARSPAPVILVSHATGGARSGYEYLGRAFASHGYVSVHLQHPGSDVDVWRGKAGGALPALRRAAADPQNAIDRVLDLRFALDHLAQDSSLDLDRVGVCGHSFGAQSALALAGQTQLDLAGAEQSMADPRVRAVVAMSSPRPFRTDADALARIFAGVRVPCLHFTGTRDDSPLNDTTAADRRIPYDNLRGTDQLLLTFAGGDHMVFAGAKRLFQETPDDALVHAIVRRAAIAFWDAYLRDDPAAREWLWDGGLAALAAGHAALEARRA
jgi:predicted dienelactone hydrolase